MLQSDNYQKSARQTLISFRQASDLRENFHKFDDAMRAVGSPSPCEKYNAPISIPKVCRNLKTLISWKIPPYLVPGSMGPPIEYRDEYETHRKKVSHNQMVSEF